LEYKNLKEIVIYAENLAKNTNKKIQFIIATNFLLMTQERAIFLRDHAFQLHISCNGKPEINDYMRDGSSSVLFTNIDALRDIIPLENISLLLAFSQKEVRRLYENIEYFETSGFKKVNLEIIANH
jgi:uncharacterized protein